MKSVFPIQISAWEYLPRVAPLITALVAVGARSKSTSPGSSFDTSRRHSLVTFCSFFLDCTKPPWTHSIAFGQNMFCDRLLGARDHHRMAETSQGVREETSRAR